VRKFNISSQFRISSPAPILLSLKGTISTAITPMANNTSISKNTPPTNNEQVPQSGDQTAPQNYISNNLYQLSLLRERTRTLMRPIELIHTIFDSCGSAQKRFVEGLTSSSSFSRKQHEEGPTSRRLQVTAATAEELREDAVWLDPNCYENYASGGSNAASGSGAAASGSPGQWEWDTQYSKYKRWNGKDWEWAPESSGSGAAASGSLGEWEWDTQYSNYKRWNGKDWDWR
jgi:hypothetical protein